MHIDFKEPLILVDFSFWRTPHFMGIVILSNLLFGKTSSCGRPLIYGELTILALFFIYCSSYFKTEFFSGGLLIKADLSFSDELLILSIPDYFARSPGWSP